MDVSPNALRKTTLETLNAIDKQIGHIELEASKRNYYGRPMKAIEMVDERGSFVLPPLLSAKAQCLNTLALLNEPRKGRFAT